MAGGRPTDYRDEYAQKLVEHFSVEPFEQVKLNEGTEKEKIQLVPGKFPTLARFAAGLGVTHATLLNWAQAKDANGNLKHPEFFEAYSRAKEYQEACLVEGAMAGTYNAQFSVFAAKNLINWRDRQEITGADGGPIKTEDVSMVEAARRMIFLLESASREYDAANATKQ